VIRYGDSGMVVKSYNSFLEHRDLEIKLATEILEKIDNSIASISGQIKYVEKLSNTKKIHFIIYVKSHERFKYVELAKDYLEKSPWYTLGDVADARRGRDFRFTMDTINRYVYVAVKPSNQLAGRLWSDVNELMTASLSLLGKRNTPITIAEADELIDEAKEKASDVVGHDADDIKRFDKDYNTLAQSISASHAVNDLVGGVPDKAFITGNKWHPDIVRFQMKDHGMRNYNSSDLVFAKGESYFGVSLKKKMKRNDADPTLLNKSFGGIINTPKFDLLREVLDVKTNMFYNGVIRNAMKEKMIVEEKQLVDDDWKKHISTISNAYVNDQLKSFNSLFKDIAEAINKYNYEIAEALLSLVFKTDLKELEPAFEFSLVTGIGRNLKRGMEVHEAEVYPLGVIIETIRCLTWDEGVDENGEYESYQHMPRLEFNSRKKQAFEEGATATKLYHVIMIGDIEILELEIRYKGTFTAQPQFFATMTKAFKGEVEKRIV
jgi:hypothetical protein